MRPMAAFTAIMAASLFIASGRLDWSMAWVYLGVYVAGQLVATAGVMRSNPGLIAERGRVQEGTKGWDRPLVGIVALLGPAAMWIVAGMDMRYRWSPPIPLALQIAVLSVAALGALLVAWAMRSNAFFSGTARIQEERGHVVATGGPYRYVRHPGYAGGILFDLATPLILCSVWALIPSALTIAVLVVRTALEDRMLLGELEGYRQYAGRVRYRLLPGMW
jgi:protein-S-isoprenylcysteine O-methyltransferase Ste14